MNFFTKLTSSIGDKVPALKNVLEKLAPPNQTGHRKKNRSSHSANAGTDSTMPTTLIRRKKRVIKTKIKKIKFNYSIEMIAELQQAHQDILRQMSVLDNAAYEKSVDAAFESLQTLFDMLDAKLSLEKSKVYPYLHKTLVNNIDAYTTMRQCRKETDKLASMLDELANKYGNLRQEPNLINSLEEDATKLNTMLIEHIREMETYLYPLYQPGA